MAPSVPELWRVADKAGSIPIVPVGSLEQHVYWSSDRHFESDAEGNPRVTSIETGEQIYDQLGDELGSLLRDLHDAAV